MSNLADKNFGENFLHKIKEGHFSPKPKWQFLLKNSLIWILGILSLILGAISTSLVFYMLNSEDARAYGRTGGNLLEKLLFIVPFFWLVCLVIFALSVYFYVKHTKKGYKYSTSKIILAIIALSLIFGGVLNALGLDRVIDDVLGERAPLYDRVINPRLNYWANPEQGRLVGLVVSQQSPTEYFLVDRIGEDWQALLSEGENDERMVIGRPVLLLGEKTGDHKFMVKEIMPVGPGRGSFKRPMENGRPMPRPCEMNKDINSGTCNMPFINQLPDFPK